MEKEKLQLASQDLKGVESASSPAKKIWQEPKLAFVEPKLTKHGSLKEVTGFFSQFSP